MALDARSGALSPSEGLSSIRSWSSTPSGRKTARTAIMRRRVKWGVEILTRKCKSQGEDINKLAMRTRRVCTCVRVCIVAEYYCV